MHSDFFLQIHLEVHFLLSLKIDDFKEQLRVIARVYAWRDGKSFFLQVMKVPVFAVSYVASTVFVTIGVYHRSKVEIELSEESVDCSVSTGIVGDLEKSMLIISERKHRLCNDQVQTHRTKTKLQQGKSFS